jgi:hypothetical protein
MTTLNTTSDRTAVATDERSVSRAFLWIAVLLMFFVGGLGFGIYSIIEMVERFRPTQPVPVEVLNSYHFRTGKNSRNHEYGVMVRLPSGHTQRVKSEMLYTCCANAGPQTAQESAYLHRIVALTINGTRHKVAPKVGFLGLMFGLFGSGLPLFVVLNLGPRALFEQLAAPRSSHVVVGRRSAEQPVLLPPG